MEVRSRDSSFFSFLLFFSFFVDRVSLCNQADLELIM